MQSCQACYRGGTTYVTVLPLQQVSPVRGFAPHFMLCATCFHNWASQVLAVLHLLHPPAYYTHQLMTYTNSSCMISQISCLGETRFGWKGCCDGEVRQTLLSWTARLMALGRPTASGPTSLASRLASLSKFLAMYSAAGCNCCSLNSLAIGSALSSICIQAKLRCRTECSRECEDARHTAYVC